MESFIWNDEKEIAKNDGCKDGNKQFSSPFGFSLTPTDWEGSSFMEYNKNKKKLVHASNGASFMEKTRQNKSWPMLLINYLI